MIGVRAQQGHMRKKPIQWKGKTFAQITTSLQRNVRNSSDLAITDHTEFMRAVSKPLPLSGYRREILSSTAVQGGNPRRSQTIMKFETPGGTTIRANFDESGTPDYETNCNSLANTLDIHYNESKYDHPNCNSALSQQENARRRVRSSGMDREIGKTKTYYTSSKEYLHSRNRRFQQNEFHHVHEQADSSKTVFRSNTIPHCAGNDYVPVFYKPNNGKFGQQGAVDSSSRITRLKYDTITDMGNTYRVAFDKYGNGNGTANALSYGVSPNAYTIKDKLGFPNTRTPVFKKNGETCCKST